MLHGIGARYPLIVVGGVVLMFATAALISRI